MNYKFNDVQSGNAISAHWGVSSDYLTNGISDELAENTLGDKELLNQFKAIEKMNDNDRFVIKKLIDAFITKGKLKQLAL